MKKLPNATHSFLNKKYALQKLRFLYFLIFLIVTIVVILFLNSSFLNIPALGKFLSPQHGVWQNVEKVALPSLSKIEISSREVATLKVLYDARHVPHVFASNEEDAYFLEGYLHAQNRLWQMDFYTYVASGRLSEIIGRKAVEIDRFFRKMDVPHLANEMLAEMESDPSTKMILDNYTLGVNEYIQKLKYAKYPIEYKIYSYKPEAWSNYKTALLMKLFAIDKSGFNEDSKKTLLAKKFGEKLYTLLYPSISTIDVPTFHSTADFDVPEQPIKKIDFTPAQKSTLFSQEGGMPLLFEEPYTPNMELGASSWAIHKDKSESGSAILCNTWSSFLSLPNVVYELQIKTPNQNVYGLSYPGIPCIMVGFNSHCAWGMNVPNVDVKDYYEVEFYNEKKELYFFNGEWKKTSITEQTIKVHDGIDVREKLIYTALGPVIFEKTINGKYKGYVLKWTIQHPSNDLKAYYLLNKMANYAEFKQAIRYLETPVQEVSFIDKEGSIALHLEGVLPARTTYQGDFVMPAKDSTYLWKYSIPFVEKPSLYNPSNGFVLSNNQMPFYPSIYPYYLGSGMNGLHSKRIYDYLMNQEKLSVQDMMTLQNDNFSSFAETLVPLLLEYLPEESVSAKGTKFIKILQNWNFRYDADEEAPTIFELWVNTLQKLILEDDLSKHKELTTYTIPPIAFIQMLQNTDVPNPLIDDKRTSKIETWNSLVVKAFDMVIPKLHKLHKNKTLEWSFNHPSKVNHPLHIDALGMDQVTLFGGSDKVLPLFADYGTQCKLIVHLSSPTEAYISTLGGQSGNPGSVFYNSSSPHFLQGQYEKIVFLVSAKPTSDIVNQTFITSQKGKQSFWSRFKFAL